MAGKRRRAKKERDWGGRDGGGRSRGIGREEIDWGLGEIDEEVVIGIGKNRKGA